LWRKGYRLKRLQEAIEGLGREKLEKDNVTDPESRLMKDSRKVSADTRWSRVSGS
jgi:hypothetical protein